MSANGSDPLRGLSIAEQVAALGGRGRGGGTRRVAEARAKVSGKSVAAELRAVQRALKSGKAPAKAAPEVNRAGERKAQAQRMRSARSVHVGAVQVRYPGAPRVAGRRHGRSGRDEGARNIGTLEVDAHMSELLAQAADAIERGDQARADELLSEAILDGYGSLGGTLEVTSWDDGLTFDGDES